MYAYWKLNECGGAFLEQRHIVRGVRAIKGLFGSDSSKAPNLAQRT